jgi:mutator protein MutT
MGDTNARGDLDTFILAGQAAVVATRAIAQRHGDRMIFVGWAAGDGTGGFGGPDSPRRIAEDAETSDHLIRLATNIASQAAVTILQSLLTGDQSREALASVAGVESNARTIIEHFQRRTRIIWSHTSAYAPEGRNTLQRICVGALVARSERGVSILLGHRAATRPFFPNVWDVPGGHCEPGELPEQTLVRELQEEIGIRPTAWRRLGDLDATVPDSDAIMIVQPDRAWQLRRGT